LAELGFGETILYSQVFMQGERSPNQCAAWQALQAELMPRRYTRVTIRGSADPVGISCSDPAAVEGIAQALHSGNVNVQYWDCDGHRWGTGSCGIGIELSVFEVCVCASPGFAVRPCIANENWGGVNTPTCDPPSQSMEVEFEYTSECIYKTRRFKQRKCNVSGCSITPAETCRFRPGNACAEGCTRKIRQRSTCADPRERGRCVNKLRNCGCD